jgi:hypothetical protein
VQTYANLWELLSLRWFTPKEIEEFERVVYAQSKLSKHLEDKIMAELNTIYP